jgi:hypothetical protein
MIGINQFQLRRAPAHLVEERVISALHGYVELPSLRDLPSERVSPAALSSVCSSHSCTLLVLRGIKADAHCGTGVGAP